MSAPKPAAISNQFLIDKINELDYAVQIYHNPGDVLVAVFGVSQYDDSGEYRRRIDQETGQDLDTTLARIARRVLGPRAEEQAG